ncbi:MAG: hypothetical protein AAB909_04530 [Patescibacteria group bacterium]
MKEQVQNAIAAIRLAKTIRGVSTAADSAYPGQTAPGGPDQKALQEAVLVRKDQLKKADGADGCHSIACGALTGGPCTC